MLGWVVALGTGKFAVVEAKGRLKGLSLHGASS